MRQPRRLLPARSGLHLSLPLAAVLAWPALAAAGEGTAGHTDPVTPFLLGLSIILAAAKLGGALFERFKLPAVLGELVVGMLAGNLAPVLDWEVGLLLREGPAVPAMVHEVLDLGQSWQVAAARHLPPAPAAEGGVHPVARLLGGPRASSLVWTVESLTTLASMGVILLLFLAGLETRVADMLRVGGRALAVATVGVVAPSLLGYLTSALLSAPYLPPAFAASPWKVHLFVGATLCATSVGITARVLQDCGRLRSREGHIILGAAVIDDVLGLIVLAIVLGVAAPGATLTLGAVGWIAAKATLFLGAALYLGVRLTPTLTRLAAMMRTAGMKLIYSLLFCFLLAWAASRIGLAAIVGAFAAGLVLDEVHFRDFRGEERTVEDLVRPIGQLLVPVFFVLMGIQIKLESLVTGWSVLVLGLLLLVAAWVGKQACALATGPGVDRLVVGLGMVPRGEVGLIFVAMGKQAGLMTDTLFSALVLTVMLTTLVTPPLLSWRFRRRAAATP